MVKAPVKKRPVKPKAKPKPKAKAPVKKPVKKVVPKPKAKPKAKAAAPKKKRGGRPSAKVNWQKVGKMCEAGASAVQIGNVLGIDPATLRRHCPIENKIS